MALHRQPNWRVRFCTLERPLREIPIMQRLVSTAKTTVIPAIAAATEKALAMRAAIRRRGSTLGTGASRTIQHIAGCAKWSEHCVFLKSERRYCSADWERSFSQAESPQTGRCTLVVSAAP